MTLKLHTIICSTRPGRVGPKVADWFHGFSGSHALFDSTLVDLADFELPLLDEPNHPRLQQYQHEHTKKWSNSVAGADAYVFVLPEYNFCPPPSFFNAIDYLYLEWNYKPCGFVSYGGVSGGLRSAQIAKQSVTTVKMMPIMESVMVQLSPDRFDDKGDFKAIGPHEESATAMLDELAKWAGALKSIR